MDLVWIYTMEQAIPLHLRRILGFEARDLSWIGLEIALFGSVGGGVSTLLLPLTNDFL